MRDRLRDTMDALAVAVKMARSRRGSVRGAEGVEVPPAAAAAADARVAFRAAVEAAHAR
jgi:hypothetical protein